MSLFRKKKKNQDSFDPRNQTLSGEDSTWMVDRLKIPRVVHCFFFAYYTIDWRWLCHNMSFVFSSGRENQILVTIATLFHHIHLEF